ncbi:chromosome segregation protein [Thalassoglobus neptunius]|uniref:Chromosome segregation protein n=1 Tax=Thalassoglobus neptunius TaxID=1938619 RepID=A0A5C5X7M4_9PLAN|nr:AAA family ATPase [Thalassoglobus neptunius]TWT58669.1 chromosome segregation protein [Thalassoglobus neptunius]
MITRIELTDFMSHRHTVIEPAEGLTVLTGPNNVGKSAIVAALQLLCDNTRGSNYAIRHGAKSCSVTITTDDGHEVTWSRSKTSSHYVIDGQRFDRIRAGGGSEELNTALRLGKVNNDGNEAFDIHFGAQKSPIFLLDKTGSSAAQFFASSSDVSRLLEMQQVHQDRVRFAKKDKGRLEKELEDCTLQLEVLKPALLIEERTVEVEKLYSQWLESQAEADSFTELVDEIAHAQTESEFHSRRASVLHKLETPPKLEETSRLDELTVGLATISQKLVLHGGQLDSLSPLTSPPELFDVDTLSHVLSSCEKLEFSIQRHESTRECLNQLDGPPRLEDTERLNQLIQSIEDADRRCLASEAQLSSIGDLEPPKWTSCDDLRAVVERMTTAVERVDLELARQEQFQELASPPEIPTVDSICEIISKLEEQQTRAEELNAKMVEIEDQMGVVEASIHDLALDQTCPVCGGNIDPEKAIRQAHSLGRG